MNSPVEFVQSLPDGSCEREYHSVLCNIISTIDFDDNNYDLGIGLLSFLETYDVVSQGINTVSHPAAGSRRENARLVAHFFSKVNNDASWWREELLRSLDASAAPSRDWWKREFETNKLVERVI